MHPSGYHVLKQRTFSLLEVGGNRFDRTIDLIIVVLITANVIAVILSTVDPLYAAYRRLFIVFELVSVAIFTVEYLGRVWACTESEEYADPVFGRLRFAGRPLLIIDLFAILPFYVGAFFIDLRFLRALRLIRFFRLLKLARYSESMRRFSHVAHEKQADLTVAISGTGILLIVSSSLMYFAERTAQPEVFSSIPAALWWGVVTLTTVGYGDVYPVTAIGKVLGAVVAILGVGLMALPASILASGFIDESTDEPRYCSRCNEVLVNKDR